MIQVRLPDACHTVQFVALTLVLASTIHGNVIPDYMLAALVGLHAVIIICKYLGTESLINCTLASLVATLSAQYRESIKSPSYMKFIAVHSFYVKNQY